MTAVINSAFSLIKHAPLRYHIDVEELQQRTPAPYPVRVTLRDKEPARTDRLEFGVRFVCGVLFGIFVGVAAGLELWDDARVLVAIVAATGLACGIAAARLGDGFWRSVLKYWWLWS